MTRGELEKLFPLDTWVVTFCSPNYCDGVKAKVVNYDTAEDGDIDVLLAVEGEPQDIPNPYVGTLEDLWEPQYVMRLVDWKAFLCWAGMQINFTEAQ
jgi:hypothetical protein